MGVIVSSVPVANVAVHRLFEFGYESLPAYEGKKVRVRTTRPTQCLTHQWHLNESSKLVAKNHIFWSYQLKSWEFL